MYKNNNLNAILVPAFIRGVALAQGIGTSQ
jgi:hypothetical protein